MPNSPVGNLVVKATDQYGNPVSNVKVLFEEQPAERIEADPPSSTIPLPEHYRNVAFYQSDECSSQYPLFGECSRYYCNNETICNGQAVVKTQYFGGMTNAVLGDTVGTKYTVHIKAPAYYEYVEGQPAVEGGDGPVDIRQAMKISMYTDGTRTNTTNYMRPTLHLGLMETYNDRGDLINAAKAGTQLTEPLRASLYLLYEDPLNDGDTSYPCNLDGIYRECWPITSDGLVKTKRIKGGTLHFTPVLPVEPPESRGSMSPVQDHNDGTYSAYYTTGTEPAQNIVEVWGEATVNVPEIRYDDVQSRTFSITQKINNEDIKLRNGQSAEFDKDTGDPLPVNCFKVTRADDGSEEWLCISENNLVWNEDKQLYCGSFNGQEICSPSKEQIIKEIYTVFGVDIDITPNPIVLNEDGYSISDTKIQYLIKPYCANQAACNTTDGIFRQYDAITAEIDILEEDSSGNESYVATLIGDNTSGEGFAYAAAGSRFDVYDKYYAQVVLNRGSGIEIRSNKVEIPIGLFKMVTNDEEEVPVIGAVTDGSATIKLQLIKYNAWGDTSELIWRIVDPQMPESTTETGTLLDENNNPVEAVPVKFNADGVAEVVYRAPDSFVRWGSAKEEDDKQTPERYIQPTFNIARYLLTRKDVLPQITLKRPPVILVHGLWGDASAWDEFVPKFNEDQIYDIYPIDYSEKDAQDQIIRVGSVFEHAYKLGSEGIIRAIRNMKKEQKIVVSEVDIVAHSMGGLLTREYCMQFEKDCENRIRRFITIATPHYGSELADILIVYRDQRHFFPNNLFISSLPIPLILRCQSRVNMIVRGEWGVKPHPIAPEGGAIDDLATGKRPDFLSGITEKGRWDYYKPLADKLRSHTIAGYMPEPFDGSSFDIISLWNVVLIPCGFTRANVYGENVYNDRIVDGVSQQGSLIGDMTTMIDFTDHFSVRNSYNTIEKIKMMIDEPFGFGSFTRE